jgi:sugar/nucleoside kinase (ribokinase family)
LVLDTSCTGEEDGAMPTPPPRRVLVVGDANPDLVLRGDVRPRFGQAEQLLDDAAFVIGGSAAITAAGLARLDRPVTLAAAVGKDRFADLLRAELAAVGVDPADLTERADIPTGLTVVLSAGDDRAILTVPGTIPTLRAADVEAALAAHPDVAHVHVASFFLQPALAAELADLLPALRARGLTTSLDPNADPAGAWVGLESLLPHLDILLPNRAEAIALGGHNDLVTAARRLAAAGPLVVVKDGAAGALAADPTGTITPAAADPRAAVDTTGAGDTFDAAFLDAWLDRRPLPDCLERAVLAGALAVTAVGGTAGQPTRSQLDPRKDR